jgi:hypothetical protein
VSSTASGTTSRVQRGDRGGKIADDIHAHFVGNAPYRASLRPEHAPGQGMDAG